MDKDSFFWKVREGKIPAPRCAQTLGVEVHGFDRMRRGTLRRLLAIAAACALAGCGAAQFMPDTELSGFLSSTSDVEFGMTKTQVQYYMKTPKNRLYQGDQEAWLWCQTSKSRKRPDAYLVVYFYRARVAGIHSYGNHAEGECEDFFRPIEWLADPEREMAAKKRRREP